MTLLSTLHTPHKKLLFTCVPTLLSTAFCFKMPNLETSCLSVASHTTLITHINILRFTFICFVAHFITFKTKLFCALKRIVSILATQNTVQSFAIVGTVRHKVTELLAISAFDSWIFFTVITSNLSFQFQIIIILVRLVVI